ncbi:uncharacterized protein LOC108511089 [Phoenix dactylifera]|uniref:Uncharacterized protein LOC108511089 n=1 Tax=Phoenix dactylifera TaxID=42345 RepID=A0A8B7MSP3_PHODC|nr:uncharacterized protein LOC108511089 [Phoenix dactylifera]
MQLIPNNWWMIVGFICFCAFHNLKFSVDVFIFFYILKKHPTENGWWYLTSGKSIRFLLDNPSFIHRWKDMYFMAISSSDRWYVSTSWGTIVERPNKVVFLKHWEKETIESLGRLRAISPNQLFSETEMALQQEDRMKAAQDVRNRAVEEILAGPSKKLKLLLSIPREEPLVKSRPI